MSTKLSVTIIVAAALASPSRAGANPSFERALQHIHDIEYEAARDALQAALEDGDNDPAALAEIYWHQGKVAAVLGDQQAAREAFQRLLSLEPTVVAPDGLAPKIADEFEAARRDMQARGRLQIGYEVSPDSTAIVMTVSADPMDMVAGVAVQLLDDDGHANEVRASGRKRAQVPLPARSLVKLTLAAIDRHGNQLVVLGSIDDPLVINTMPSIAAPAMPEPRDTERTVVGRWYVWAGAAVGFGAAGAVFGWRASVAEDDRDAILADSEQYFYSDAQSAHDRARRNALLANIGFAGAAVFGVTSVVLLIRDRGGDSDGERRTAIAPVPMKGGLGVSAEVRF